MIVAVKTTLLPVILIILTCVPDLSAIKCYKCLSTKPFYYTNETYHLCDGFDYDEKYIVDCPYSTFCMKKISAARIAGLINGTDRDCAHQKNATQNYKDDRWQLEITIAEPYKEGCSKEDTRGLKTAEIHHCYCRGDLCNGAAALSHSSYLMATLSVIVMFLLCRK